MAWEKFRHLTRPDDDGPSIRVDGFAPLGREKPPPRPLPGETGAGGPARIPDEVERYAAVARARLRSPRVGDDYWLPDRIREMTEGRDVGGFLDLFIADLIRAPSEAAFVAARALLNELGRDPHSAAIMRERLTPEVMARAIAAGRRRTRRG